MNRIYTLLFFTLLFCSVGTQGQSISTLLPTGDTYADGGKPNDIQNTKLSEQMGVKTGSSATFTRVGYIKFDISGINLADVEGGDLNETTISSNAQPTLIQPAIRSKKMVAPAYNEWGITRLVQSAIINGKRTTSLGLTDITAGNKLSRFYTKESSNENKPQLKINSEKENSPAIASGKEIIGNATMDYFGNTVPTSGTLDQGVQQFSSPSDTSTPGGFTKENFDIYLLIGQSNMAGRGDIESIDEVPLEKAYLFDDAKNWENASVPLNKYSTTRKSLVHQKMNPGYTFARKLTEYTNKGIGLVVNARGGTSIEQWQKGYTGSEDFDLYEEAVARLLAAKKDGTFKGIIWHQGESNQSSSAGYMAKLKNLVSDLRADLGENVFFVAGEIGQWRGEISVPMNNVIRGIANDINQASYVKSDDLKPINNDLGDPHFNGYSQRILGGLYADEVLKNIYQISPGVASLYSKCDYKGYKVVLNSGIYTLEELQKRGIYDNDIHSIEVEKGYEVLLYTGQKEGQSTLISASKDCLADTSVNENVSYVVIGKTGTTENPNLSID